MTEGRPGVDDDSGAATLGFGSLLAVTDAHGWLLPFSVLLVEVRRVMSGLAGCGDDDEAVLLCRPGVEGSVGFDVRDEPGKVRADASSRDLTRRQAVALERPGDGAGRRWSESEAHGSAQVPVRVTLV